MAPAKKAKAKDNSKAAAKAAKKDKQASKQAKKDAGIKGKGKSKDDEEDLEDILERFQEEWKQSHAITEENQSEPPSRRANASFTPCPSGNHLWLIGGEVFDGERATFFNDTYRYSPDKNEWRLYTSPTAPAPRSAHAVVALPTDGGQLLLFGGEYASPSQTSFHHYRDVWLFSIKSHAWEKIETKIKPTARSGHRMVLWKHYVILFGGFIDVGVKTNYLSDLWIFNTEEYKWKQIEIADKDRCPGPRSGFSFIPCAEGAILHGGYRKEYIKGNRPKGLPLEDTWLLRMDSDLSKLKWERRKKAGYAPSLRSGCSMTYWASKQMGVLFGGVFDEEKDEESMESIFHNDMFAYNPAGNGRWMSLNLKKRKKMGGKKRVKKIEPVRRELSVDEHEDDDVEMADGDGDDAGRQREDSPMVVDDEDEDDPDDPLKTVPLTRYNAMLAVLKNTLYIYGGIYETAVPAREYTLDDFITLNLEKLDKFTHIRGSGLEDLEWKASDDEDGGNDSDDSDSDDERRGRDDEEEEESEDDDEDVIPTDDEDLDEEERERRHAALTQKERDALRASATKFLGVSKDATRSEEEVLQTPQPGETLRLFFERSREYWVGTAFSGSSNRGKALRREAFKLAADKYEEYKPLLEEIERIQREAEVTAADTIKRGPAGASEGGRNRR